MATEATTLPCGSCGAPQPLGTAACSECALDPRWIVEPCEACQGSPAHGCRRCMNDGWTLTAFEQERGRAWLQLKVLGAGTELVEAGDAALPDPASEYSRREALRTNEAPVDRFAAACAVASRAFADLSRAWNGLPEKVRAKLSEGKGPP